MVDESEVRPPVDYEPLNTLVEAAFIAGGHADEQQETVVQDVKEDGSAVTEADYECEQLIRNTLNDSGFGYPIFGEEYGKSVESLGDTYWVVDPIDGTRNYANGLPQYATSLALVRDGVVDAGVVYAPATETLFAGARNKGVYVNGRHETVSDRFEASGAKYIVTGTWTDHQVGRYAYGQQLPSKFVMYLGCASLALAYQAVGRCDGGAVGSLSPWDIGGGLCLIQEAEGSAIGFDGATDWAALDEGWFTMDNGSDDVREAIRGPIQ